MNKQEIIKIIKELYFSKTQYWLVTGSALVLHNIKEETKDIDLGVTKELINELIEKGYSYKILPDHTRYIKYSENIEIYENWLYDKIEYIDNIPVISLQGLIEMKEKLGRDKDIEDIKLIKRNKNH